MKNFYKQIVGAAWQMGVAIVSGLVVDTFRELYYYGKDLYSIKNEQQNQQPTSSSKDNELVKIS